MLIYDITQDLAACRVYPGDPHPKMTRLKSFEQGDQSTVTQLSMQVHAGTHIDAPIHRVRGGKGINELSLAACIGPCEVIDYAHKDALRESEAKRILLKNCQEIDEETARILVEKQVVFAAVEGPSVGNRAVHSILLENEVVVLEGAVLQNVPEGTYKLYAPPIVLGNSDGAPCRAVLIKDE